MATLTEIAAQKDDYEVDFDAIERLKAESGENTNDAPSGAVETGPKREITAKTTEKPQDSVRIRLNGPDTDEVEIVDEADDEATPPVVTVDEGLAKLKAQLASEKTAREAAERRAREASDAEVRARTESHDTRLTLVSQAIEALKQTSQTLKSQYVEALTVQDFAKVADLQMDMATAAANLQQLERGKTALEQAPKPTAAPITDPVEQFAARCEPAAAAWVRAHPEYVLDAKKNRKMIAAHDLALSDDIEANTPEYFASIERTLGLSQADEVREEPRREPKTAVMSSAAAPAANSRSRAAPPASAPVSRGGNGQGSQSHRVTLSAAEREVARLNKMTDEEYARNKVALRKEGLLN